MNSNLTPARFVRMVGEWMDAGGYVLPVDLYVDGKGEWVCEVGDGWQQRMIAEWKQHCQCYKIKIDDQNFLATEQGLTEALTELTIRMEKGNERNRQNEKAPNGC